MVRDSLAPVQATTPSGKRAAAKIIAHDYSRNLTLLKVNTDGRTQFYLSYLGKSQLANGLSL